MSKQRFILCISIIPPPTLRPNFFHPTNKDAAGGAFEVQSPGSEIWPKAHHRTLPILRYLPSELRRYNSCPVHNYMLKCWHIIAQWRYKRSWASIIEIKYPKNLQKNIGNVWEIVWIFSRAHSIHFSVNIPFLISCHSAHSRAFLFNIHLKLCL